MIGLESLQWLLTLAFSATTVYHLLHFFRPATERLTDALHAVMGVSMIAMMWPWGAAVPRAAWIVAYLVPTCWFAARASRRTGHRAASLATAAMMGAMVWMGAAMPAQASSGGHEHHAHHAAGYTAWISVGIGTFLVAAAIWWLIRATRADELTPSGGAAVNWSALCHGVMSAGMGVALLAMI